MVVRVFLLVAASFGVLHAQEGAEYLQNAVRDLHSINSAVGQRRADPVRKTPRSSVPPLTLTKGELAALYEAAVSKGNTINNAAVHELDGQPTWTDDHHHHHHHHHQEEQHPAHHQHDDSASSGYYYYYYPIKSFMDELSSQPAEQHHDHSKDYHPHHHEPPPSHYHHHEHNVHITPMKAMDMDKKKGLEPLFMAISGFIGMAIMFVLSTLVLPKLGVMKSRDKKPSNPEISTIARIALQAIEGHDCAERLACELGKGARAFSLYDNRFVKFLRRVAPVSFGRQIDKVGKYTDRKHRCAAIQCKRKGRPKGKH